MSLANTLLGIVQESVLIWLLHMGFSCHAFHFMQLAVKKMLQIMKKKYVIIGYLRQRNFKSYITVYKWYVTGNIENLSVLILILNFRNIIWNIKNKEKFVSKGEIHLNFWHEKQCQIQIIEMYSAHGLERK